MSETMTEDLDTGAARPLDPAAAAPRPAAGTADGQPLFRQVDQPLAARARDLLDRLTPDERIAMLHQAAPAIERLGVAEWRTGCEALHGAAWLGRATVFPQSVGLAATWDTDLSLIHI